MTEENAKVNVQIPANRVQGIISLYREWTHSREATIEEMHRELEGATKMIERRINFFDRLILLAGGSFALSLTFLSTLHKPSLQNVGCLKVAWVFMLLCIVFSGIHNWYRCAAAERVFLGVQRRASSFRHQVNARFAARGSGLWEGVTAADVNFGEFFDLLKSYWKSESDKAESEAEQTRKELIATLVKAIWIGNVAILCLVVSFVLLLAFALRNVPFL
jgi:hypothetical protein